MLQSHGCKRHETVGCRGAELGQLFILGLDQLGCRVAFRAIPVGVDAERLDIDPLGVHLRDAVRQVAPQQTGRLERMADHGRRLGHDAMSVDVDRLYPLAVDHDLAPPPRARRRAGIPQAASDKGEPGQGPGD
jgi:hypothetical protein